MITGVLIAAERVVESYGPIAILAIFVLEGALVGKLIPTRTVFIGAVVLLGGSVTGYLSVFVAAVVGATIGQHALFVLVRSGYVDARHVRRLRWVRARWFDRVVRWFDSWGLPVLFVTNMLPIVRGYPIIPVALSSAPGYRFSIVSTCGTVVYVSALVLIGTGVDVLLRAFG